MFCAGPLVMNQVFVFQNNSVVTTAAQRLNNLECSDCSLTTQQEGLTAIRGTQIDPALKVGRLSL